MNSTGAWYSNELQILDSLTGYQNTCSTGITLYMRPANERRRYNVTSSLIGWVHSQKQSLVVDPAMVARQRPPSGMTNCLSSRCDRMVCFVHI